MHVRWEEVVEGRVWNNLRGMVQPRQQHVAPCVKGVGGGLGMRGERILAAFSASIPVSSA